jgi:hypothetical protein
MFVIYINTQLFKTIKLTTKFCSRGNSGTKCGTVMIQKSLSGNLSNALAKKSADLKKEDRMKISISL